MIIIATIGLNTFDEGKIRRIILSGANVLRFNLSLRTADNNIKYIHAAQQIIDELNAQVDIMIDLPFSKIRLGDFAEKVIEVKENQELILKCGFQSPSIEQFVPVQTTDLGEKVKINQVVTVGDGEIALQVLDIIDKDTITVKVLNNGSLYYMRSFNINWRMAEERMLENYRQLIETVKEVNPKFICFSYLNRSFGEKIKESIRSTGRAHAVAKIERQLSAEDQEYLYNDSFYKHILFDRGEAGVNMPFEKVGVMQKQIIKKAHEHKKFVIISTHILESSVNNLIPYRAEITDLTNMVLEGVEGIMLCHETAIGLRPAYTISIARKIIAEAEKYKKECAQT